MLAAIKLSSFSSSASASVLRLASPSRNHIQAFNHPISRLFPVKAMSTTADGPIVETKPVVKVAALCGSLRRASYNHGLLRAATEICKESITDMQIEYIDIGGLPLMNVDLEVGGKFPEEVEVVRQKILAADCLLFASPEYNYSVSAPLKNAIDWASRHPNSFADKTAAIISAGGGSGGMRSQYHLRQIGVFLDLHFINKPEFSVKAFEQPQKFDKDGNLIDADSRERLKNLLMTLKAFTLRVKA